MATINLLPWREQRREELKKEFFVVLGMVVVGALLLVVLIDRGFNYAIDQQNGRNSFIQTNINDLNKQVAEIKGLKKKRSMLLERMKVIQSLQGNRPHIVRLFDEMVRTVPDGVYYRSLSRKAKNITISGTAESNNRVSSLMRKLDGSDWFVSPNLKSVKANPAFGDQANNFQLAVVISAPKTKKTDQKGEK
jgi:type IV pilus assembly protein PilN